MERYYDLGDDTLEVLNNLISKFVPTTVRLEYAFIGDNKLKKLLKVSKISDVNQHLTKGKQVLITVNESLWDAISEKTEVIEILVREEFNGLVVNTETGKIKIEKLSFITSNSIIEKYTFDLVREAKELEKSVLEQTDEKEKEMIDISM